MDNRHRSFSTAFMLVGLTLSAISLFFALTTNSFIYLATTLYLGWLALEISARFYNSHGKKYASELLLLIPFLGGAVIALGAGTIINDSIFFADQHRVLSINGSDAFPIFLLLLVSGYFWWNFSFTRRNIRLVLVGLILFATSFLIHSLASFDAAFLDLIAGAIFSLILVYKGIELMWKTYQKIDEQLHRRALREWPSEQPFS